MTFKKTIRTITAIIAIMAMMSTATFAATVQPRVAEVEVISSKVEETNVTKYPKSMQRIIFESAEDGKAEVARVQSQIATLKENTVAVDENGIAWKSGKGQNVEKVRVTSGKINFEWTPIYIGYTWMSDLSMWSGGQLPGKEAKLEFLDKDKKVLWTTNVTFKKQVKKNTNKEEQKTTSKEEIVPPCPNDMAPVFTPTPGVEIGVAPGK